MSPPRAPLGSAGPSADAATVLTSLLTAVVFLGLAGGGLLLFRRRRALRSALGAEAEMTMDADPYDPSHPSTRSPSRSFDEYADAVTETFWREAHIGPRPGAGAD